MMNVCLFLIDIIVELLEEVKKEDNALIVPLFQAHGSKISQRNIDRESSASFIETENKHYLNHLKSIQISLCHKELISEPNKAEEIFKKHIVNKDEFMDNPWKILNHPNLLICYADKLYTYNAAVPLLMSLLVYKEEPPVSVINKLLENKSIFDFLRSKKPNLNTIKLHTNGESCEEFVNKLDIRIKKTTSLKKIKSLTPSTEELKLLGLVDGKNEIAFVCYSKLSGRQILRADIYLWSQNSKIIISDVDGTITRSDVLGHLMPIVGKDWSHDGIVELYNNIEANGYKFLYLTARSICQSIATKNYLQNLNQSNLLEIKT
jgi:phosphatidate phosphatase LPIN